MIGVELPAWGLLVRDETRARAPFLVALEGVIQVIISVLKRLVSRMRK